MSRLIDADDLIIEILTHDLIGDDKEVDKIILDAPTVKAIPIEWIERFMNRFITPEGVSGDAYALLHYMVCEWEYENEQTNRC